MRKVQNFLISFLLTLSEVYCFTHDGPLTHTPLVSLGSVTDVGIVIVCPLSKPQSQNVPRIFVTLLGIVGAVVSEVQYLNVLFIFVTLLGIAGAVVKDLQPLNV